MTRRARANCWAVVAGAILAAVAAGPAPAQQPKDPVAEGERLFRDHGCYGCHMIGKMGTPIATDLTRIGARRSADSLAAWLRDPRAQKPTAHMPKIAMPESEARALAAFLAAQR